MTGWYRCEAATGVVDNPHGLKTYLFHSTTFAAAQTLYFVQLNEMCAEVVGKTDKSEWRARGGAGCRRGIEFIPFVVCFSSSALAVDSYSAVSSAPAHAVRTLLLRQIPLLVPLRRRTTDTPPRLHSPLLCPDSTSSNIFFLAFLSCFSFVYIFVFLAAFLSSTRALSAGPSTLGSCSACLACIAIYITGSTQLPHIPIFLCARAHMGTSADSYRKKRLL